MTNMGVARGAVGAGASPGAKKRNFGAEFIGVSCKCTPEGESVPPWEGRSDIFTGRRRVRGVI